MTTRSILFRNSGLNVVRRARSARVSLKPPSVCSKPIPGPAAIADPTLVVRTMTQRRKSTTWPCAVGEPPVVEDLEEDVPDGRRGLLELVEQHHA